MSDIDVKTHETKLDGYESSVVEANVSGKKGTVNMMVSKTVDETDPNTTRISTTTSTNITGKTTDFSEKTTSTDKYNAQFGIVHDENTTVTENKTDVKGRIRSYYNAKTHVHSAQVSSRDAAEGYTEGSDYESNSSHRSSFNKKGQETETEIHHSYVGAHSSSFDQKVTYNKDGSVATELTGRYGNSRPQILEQKGKTYFSATMRSDGQVDYLKIKETKNKYKVTEVSVNPDGDTQALKFTMRKDAENARREEVRQCNALKEVRKMQKQADKAIQNVTNSSSQTFAEYASNRTATQGAKPPLDSAFYLPSQDTVNAQKAIEEQRSAQQAEAIAQGTQEQAIDIMKIKLSKVGSYIK